MERRTRARYIAELPGGERIFYERIQDPNQANGMDDENRDVSVAENAHGVLGVVNQNNIPGEIAQNLVEDVQNMSQEDINDDIDQEVSDPEYAHVVSGVDLPDELAQNLVENVHNMSLEDETGHLDDSIEFIQEYIVLDGPELNRQCKGNSQDGPLISSENTPSSEVNAIAQPPMPLKMETVAEIINAGSEIGLSQENDANVGILALEQKPIVLPTNSIAQPPMPLKLENAHGNDMQANAENVSIRQEANNNIADSTGPEIGIDSTIDGSSSCLSASIESSNDESNGSTEISDFEIPQVNIEDLRRLYGVPTPPLFDETEVRQVMNVTNNTSPKDGSNMREDMLSAIGSSIDSSNGAEARETDLDYRRIESVAKKLEF